MLVEDDENDIALTERALVKAGITFSLLVLRNGQEAINYFSEVDRGKFPHPNWIISDLKMPLVNGLDLLAWLKKSEVQVIPTIMMSSSRQPKDVMKAYELGVSSYFCKPNSFQETIQLWKNVCEYWAEAEFPTFER